MTEQITNWLDTEAEQLTKHADYEKLPSLKLTPNVVTDIIVDSSVPFQEWSGEDSKGKPIKKKIIPVTVAGQKMNFWLNVKNPLYAEIVNSARAGQKSLKILQTGTQQNTKYVLVK